MKAEVLQENLARGLGAVSRFVAVKPTLPVLAMVLIRAEKGKVVLVTTDMDTGIEVGMGAKVEKEGEVVVPAKIVLEYVNLLPSGKIILGVEKKELVIVSGKNKAKIAGMDAKDFPTIPEFREKEEIIVESGEMERIVRLVGFASLNEATRPALSAILFKINGEGKMEVVATDGYRLSLMSNQKYEGKAGEVGVLISSRVVGELVRLLGDEGGESVKVWFDKSQKSVAFMFGRVKLVTRLIEGEFPAYGKIIPSESGIVFKSDRDELLEGVKIAAVFARESSNIIRWGVEKKGVVMSSNSTNVGEQECVVEGELVKGEGNKIAFNSKFLIELLGNVSGGMIEFSMNGPLQPGVFRSGDKNFVHVIMPVRVQGENQ